MKKSFLFGTVGLMFVLLLQNCKPEKNVAPPPTDPDSLYIGTTYTIAKPYRFPTITNPYKDSLTVEGIELGRRLFYDKHLSSTGLLACASCHRQEFAFSDAGNAKSTNVFGTTKRNAPAIENLLWAGSVVGGEWTGSLFWDGRANSLGAQAKDAFHGEQNMDIPNLIAYLKTDSTYTRLFRKAFGRPGDVTEEKIYLAVQQFMMTLISSDSHFDKVMRGQEQFTASELNGLNLFTAADRGDCTHCHVPQNGTILFTDNFYKNNGIDSVGSIDDYIDKGRGAITADPNDNGKFRDPSLRNIALTGPYMHDGRYQTLDQVINYYSDSVRTSGTVDAQMFVVVGHPDGKRQFTQQEHDDLMNFLNSLTDTVFTHNPNFSNPF